jgi:RHS repeat-associated protein
VSSVTTTFAYNGDGLRDSLTANSNTTTFTWDVNRSIPQVLDDEDLRYVYGIGRIAQAGASTHYYLSDGLGSTLALTDADGDVVNDYDYDVFGALRDSSGSQDNDFTFTGEQVDGSTGLQYLRARYYDEATGRFVGKDPFPGVVGLPDSQNSYAYVLNNPAVMVDPYGLKGFPKNLNPVNKVKSVAKTVVNTCEDVSDAVSTTVDKVAAIASRFATLNCLDAGLGAVALAATVVYPPAGFLMNAGRAGLGLTLAATERTALVTSIMVNGRQFKNEGGLANAAGMALSGTGFFTGLAEDAAFLAGKGRTGLGMTLSKANLVANAAGFAVSAYQCYQDVK